jgi:outer membrane lipoprotein-sorting protein
MAFAVIEQLNPIMTDTRRSSNFCLLLLVLAGISVASYPQAKSPQTALDQALERMAAIGRDFHSFSADFTQRKYIAVLKEFDNPESGIFIYARAKDGSALLRQEFRAPGHKILTIKGGSAMVYQPSLNQASIVNLGKNKDKAEFLALGIGQSPAKLRETFNIEYQGEEKVDGAPCSVLQLKPKSSSAAAFLASITLWISNSNNLPIQQKLQEPNGDYLLNKFSAEKLNSKVADSDFEQKLPKGVDVQQIK